ncbi:hypothetical protein BDP81DRAFT_163619 [Colletotrichum phormii]|uniref:Uncharacterized protein n=1 Tax=Colletotrichum phormii TaxID=359342 RepID=A0AAJ0A1M2_9PEZI|nr:uncharacterized protein BDP81DRAFT_163619 [Colletotrichum phormii]KAK1640457.1 hypothetical protein BDP81DRAFT_163619 [Colletotrichum phormii]
MHQCKTEPAQGPVQITFPLPSIYIYIHPELPPSSRPTPSRKESLQPMPRDEETSRESVSPKDHTFTSLHSKSNRKPHPGASTLTSPNEVACSRQTREKAYSLQSRPPPMMTAAPRRAALRSRYTLQKETGNAVASLTLAGRKRAGRRSVLILPQLACGHTSLVKIQ